MKVMKTGICLAAAALVAGCGQVLETAYDEGLSQGVTRVLCPCKNFTQFRLLHDVVHRRRCIISAT